MALVDDPGGLTPPKPRTWVARPRHVTYEEQGPLNLLIEVNSWLTNLPARCLSEIKIALAQAESSVWISEGLAAASGSRKLSSPYAMRWAFDRIARTLFDAGCLSLERLEDIELLVWETAWMRDWCHIDEETWIAFRAQRDHGDLWSEKDALFRAERGKWRAQVESQQHETPETAGTPTEVQAAHIAVVERAVGTAAPEAGGKGSASTPKRDQYSERDARIHDLIGGGLFNHRGNSEIMRDPTVKKLLKTERLDQNGDAAKNCFDRIRKAKGYLFSRKIKEKRARPT